MEGKNIQPIIKKKSIQRSAFIAIPIVLPLILAGPQLFAFVFMNSGASRANMHKHLHLGFSLTLSERH